MSWPLGKVTDIAEIISGFAFKSEWFGAGDAKVIRIGDLKNGRIDLSEAMVFDEKVHKVREQYRVKNGDILMALSGATVGKIAVADLEAEGAYLNQRVAVIRGKCYENTEFLKYIFTGSRLQKLLLNAGGAAQPNLSPKNLAEMEIPIPPLTERKRIATILNKADNIRQKREQAIKLADDFLRTKFLDMFSNEKIKKYSIVKIDDLLALDKNSIRTGPFGSQLLHSEFTESGIAVLGIDNAVRNEFQWGKPRFISPNKYETLKRYTVLPGDVIITIMGTCGRCAVVPDDISVAINTKHLCCISLNKDKCAPEFLHSYFLTHPLAKEYLAKHSKGAIMDGLNMGVIKHMPFPEIPLEQQYEFVNIKKKIKQLKSKLNSSKIACEYNFTTLCNDIFNMQG
ncbi:restriction endonuclease subunit S [Cronobacter sakazakii]